MQIKLDKLCACFIKFTVLTVHVLQGDYKNKEYDLTPGGFREDSSPQREPSHHTAFLTDISLPHEGELVWAISPIGISYRYCKQWKFRPLLFLPFRPLTCRQIWKFDCRGQASLYSNNSCSLQAFDVPFFPTDIWCSILPAGIWCPFSLQAFDAPFFPAGIWCPFSPAGIQFSIFPWRYLIFRFSLQAFDVHFPCRHLMFHFPLQALIFRFSLQAFEVSFFLADIWCSFSLQAFEVPFFPAGIWSSPFPCRHLMSIFPAGIWSSVFPCRHLKFHSIRLAS